MGAKELIASLIVCYVVAVLAIAVLCIMKDCMFTAFVSLVISLVGGAGGVCYFMWMTSEENGGK